MTDARAVRPNLATRILAFVSGLFLLGVGMCGVVFSPFAFSDLSLWWIPVITAGALWLAYVLFRFLYGGRRKTDEHPPP